MDECPVCFEDLDARIRTTTPCGHHVCLGCLLALARPPRCPMCRADLAPLFPSRLQPLLLPPPSVSSDVSSVIELALASGAAPRNSIRYRTPTPSLRRLVLMASQSHDDDADTSPPAA